MDSFRNWDVFEEREVCKNMNSGVEGGEELHSGGGEDAGWKENSRLREEILGCTLPSVLKFWEEAQTVLKWSAS